MNLILPGAVQERIDLFSGRTWLLPILQNWLRTGNERVFLLTGGPGTGKSMIMAWLAGYGSLPEDEENRNRLAALRAQVAAGHFLQANSRNMTRLVFSETIANQLSDSLAGYDEALTNALRLHGLNIDVFQAVGKAERSATVIGLKIGRINLAGLVNHDPFDLGIVQPLKHLYQNGYERPILLLIDALDEAYVDARGGDQLVTLLSGLDDLPEQVRILATSRPDPRVTKHFRRARTLDLIADAPGDSADIYHYVYDWLLNREHLEARDARQLAKRIDQAASGIFLYATMVLHDIVPQLPLSDDEFQFPVGLSGLYHDFFTREIGQIDARWYDELRPLLGLIAVAKGEGLTRQQLRAMLGTDPTKNLRICHQYLSGKLNDGPFRLFHKSLADYLLLDEENIDYEIDAAEMHYLITDFYFTKYKNIWRRCDLYGLVNIIDHLIASELSTEEIRALLEVILSNSYVSAIQSRLGWLNSLVEDLENLADLEPELVVQLCYALILERPPISLVIQKALRLLIKLKRYALAVDTAGKQDRQDLQRVVAIMSGPPAEAQDNLLEMLEQTAEKRVRGLIVLALAETGSKDVTPKLVKLLKEGRREVSWAAADALLALNDRDIIPGLVQWYQAIQHKNDPPTSADKQRILYVLGWMRAEEAQVLKETAFASLHYRVIGRGVDLCWLLQPAAADQAYLAERLQAVLDSPPEEPQVLGPWKDEWLQKRLVRAVQRLRMVELLPQLRQLQTHIQARAAPRKSGWGTGRPAAKRERLLESVEEAITKLERGGRR